MKLEEKLIINFCRTNISNDKKMELIELLKNNIDWKYFVLNCLFNRVENIVYSNIIYYELDKYFNPYIVEVFKREYNKTANNSIKLHSYFKEVIYALNQNNIEYAAIKGYVFEDFIYYLDNRKIVRRFNDLDFLIKKEDSEKIEKIFNSIGFKHGILKNNMICDISRYELLRYKMTTHQLAPFFKIEDNLIVEVDLNFSMFYGGKIKDPISLGYILKSRIIVDNNDVSYYRLSYEYMFINMIINTYKDYEYVKKGYNKNVFLLQKLFEIREFIVKYKKKFCVIKFEDIIKNPEIITKVVFVIKVVDIVYGENLIESCIGDKKVLELYNCTNVTFEEIKNIIFKRMRKIL